jgi:hypothetical protein
MAEGIFGRLSVFQGSAIDLHKGVAKAPLCNLVAASSFSTSVAVRCLRSVIVLSNVGGEKHPATPGTAQGRELHIRQYDSYGDNPETLLH